MAFFLATTKQKFPAESVLIFMQEMDRRFRMPQVREAWMLQLSQMARRGIYDHVNGGFYRYATDRTWVVPHYEKMLYNQALLLHAYAQGMQLEPTPLYRWVLQDTLGFVDDWLRREDGLFFSALSAESEDVEGLYYFWPAAELARIPERLKARASLVSHPVPGQKRLRGIYFARPETPAAAELRLRMRQLSRKNQKPAVDQKIISAWNAALLSALVAVEKTKPAFKETENAHSDIEKFAESLWRNLYAKNERRLARFVMKKSSTSPGTLEDYALMCRAFLDVYDITRKPIWLERAKRLGEDIQNHFWDAGSFTFLDQRVPQTFALTENDFSDGEMPNADAVALQALWRLVRRTGNDAMRYQLDNALVQMRQAFRRRPFAHVYAATVLAEIDLGAVDGIQYFGGGVGRIQAKAITASAKTNCQLAELDVSLAEGWHVNADKPLQDHLQPTRLTAKVAGRDKSLVVRYPKPERVRLGFEKSPMDVYAGNFTLQVHSADPTDCMGVPRPLTLDVELQTCSDRICRRPERLQVSIP